MIKKFFYWLTFFLPPVWMILMLVFLDQNYIYLGLNSKGLFMYKSQIVIFIVIIFFTQLLNYFLAKLHYKFVIIEKIFRLISNVVTLIAFIYYLL